MNMSGITLNESKKKIRSRGEDLNNKKIDILFFIQSNESSIKKQSLQEKLKYNNINMGCWDIFCCVCGNTYHTPNVLFNEDDNESFGITEDDCNAMDNVSTHLNKCSVILKNGDVIHGCYNNNGNDFSKGDDSYECIFDGFKQFGDDDKVGVFVHTDCYNFVKKDYGVELKFSHFPIIDNNMPNVNYGKIADYWQQDMDYFQMLKDNNMYMTANPMTDTDKTKKHKTEMARLLLKKNDKIDKGLKMIDDALLKKKTKDKVFKAKIMGFKAKIMDIKQKMNIKMESEMNEKIPEYLHENRQRIRNIVVQFNLPSQL